MHRSAYSSTKAFLRDRLANQSAGSLTLGVHSPIGILIGLATALACFLPAPVISQSGAYFHTGCSCCYGVLVRFALCGSERLTGQFWWGFCFDPGAWKVIAPLHVSGLQLCWHCMHASQQQHGSQIPLPCFSEAVQTQLVAVRLAIGCQAACRASALFYQ